MVQENKDPPPVVFCTDGTTAPLEATFVESPLQEEHWEFILRADDAQLREWMEQLDEACKDNVRLVLGCLQRLRVEHGVN